MRCAASRICSFSRLRRSTRGCAGPSGRFFASFAPSNRPIIPRDVAHCAKNSSCPSDVCESRKLFTPTLPATQPPECLAERSMRAACLATAASPNPSSTTSPTVSFASRSVTSFRIAHRIRSASSSRLKDSSWKRCWRRTASSPERTTFVAVTEMQSSRPSSARVKGAASPPIHRATRDNTGRAAMNPRANHSVFFAAGCHPTVVAAAAPPAANAVPLVASAAGTWKMNERATAVQTARAKKTSRLIGDSVPTRPATTSSTGRFAAAEEPGSRPAEMDARSAGTAYRSAERTRGWPTGRRLRGWAWRRNEGRDRDGHSAGTKA
mmetsp:Transcript_6701/g.16096  ORF Transcript_6701/g.16096 Transcript_6701/m.16096 type:complete len:323 (-) Transcript_6701:116-1084(-)